MSEQELEFIKRTILKRIDLIDIQTLSPSSWDAGKLTVDVDQFDAPFVALSLELNSPLRTGDKKLIRGLQTKGVGWALDTQTILNLRDSL